MAKTYNRVNWVNNSTPVNATNLNNMDKGIKDAIEQGNTTEEALADTTTTANAAKEKADANEQKLSNIVTYQEALNILEGGQ